MQKHHNMGLSIIRHSLLLLFITTYSPSSASHNTEIGYPPEHEPPAPDIVGGQDAELGEWPWHVGLVDSGSSNAFSGYFCGGALIDDEWVVTAAHCAYDFFGGGLRAPSSVDVILGRTKLSSNQGQRMAVSQIIPHPLYASSSDNDIALIRLAQAVNISEYVQTISIVAPFEVPLTSPNTIATVTGWGTTSNWGFFPVDDLKEVNVPIVSQQVCQAAYNSEGVTITDKMLCAGEDGKDACYWDSGGPLTVLNASQDGFKLAGIVSTGSSAGCGAIGKFGIYTRVSMFAYWLKSTTGAILFGYQVNLPLVIK